MKKKKSITKSERMNPHELANVYATLKLSARVDALQTTLVSEMRRNGLDMEGAEQVEEFIDELGREYLQKKLERIETDNPEIAALLCAIREPSDEPKEF